MVSQGKGKRGSEEILKLFSYHISPLSGYGALSLSSFLSNIEKPTPSPLSPSPSEAYSSLSPFTLSHPYFFPSSSSSSSSPPLISPILSLAQISPSHLSSFPPTLLQTTSSELLLSDSLLFEQKLREVIMIFIFFTFLIIFSSLYL